MSLEPGDRGQAVSLVEADREGERRAGQRAAVAQRRPVPGACRSCSGPAGGGTRRRRERVSGLGPLCNSCYPLLCAEQALD